MKKALLPAGVAVFLSTVLLGCTQGNQDAATTSPVVEPAATQSEPQTQPTEGLSTSQTPAPAVSAAPVSELSLQASDASIQNWPGIGSKEGGVLKSNATNGYLMFGPKVAFNPGTYQVTVQGNALKVAPENAVTFDVTSNAGKTVYTKKVIDASTPAWTAGAPLTTFEFTLPTPVTDLEIRAFVSSGSEVEISGYDIKPVQK